MPWIVERIINYPETKPWGEGFAHYGFHDRHGTRYFFHYFDHWVGCLGKDDEFLWTAGLKADVQRGFHIDAHFEWPMFLTEMPDGRLLVSCNGNAKIFHVDPKNRRATLFLDAAALGCKDISSTVCDRHGNLWISEVTGCRVWHVEPTGRVIDMLGDGQPGFQRATVSFDEARFGWIYVMRIGPNGHLYVLDSTNFAVRRINVRQRTVQTVVGTGEAGYTGDGGPARLATMGSDPKEQFTGPYGMCIDEEGCLYIADTYNHVVRQVDAEPQTITTIAGNHEVVPHQRNDPSERDPRRLNLPKLSALDYYDGRLFVPEWDGDLVILKRQNDICHKLF